MNEQEARCEAERRWGAHAVVSVDETTCLVLHLVGELKPGEEPLWHGIGRTWELAFAEAELRQPEPAR